MPTVLAHMVQNALVKGHFIHAFAKKDTEERIAVVCETIYYSIFHHWCFLPTNIQNPAGNNLNYILVVSYL